MKFVLPSRLSGCARLALVALAIVAILGLATPTASAAVTLGYDVVSGNGPATSYSSFASSGPPTWFQSGTTNSIGWSITANETDAASGSGLTTVTINLSNAGSGTNTITIGVQGSGYTMGGTAASGKQITESSSLQGTAGPPYNGANDSASGYSVIAGNTLTTQNATVSGSSSSGTGTYSISLPTVNTTGTLSGSPFSIVQQLTITLGAGDKSSFTFTSGTGPVVPEPSTLAIAGLGALGMIGYGLRRRKALGA